MGAIQFSEEAAREHNVKVRILMPSHKSNEDIVRHLKENYAECINIRYIEKMSDTKATILVVDRKVSLVMELRDDSKRTFDEAIGYQPTLIAGQAFYHTYQYLRTYGNKLNCMND